MQEVYRSAAYDHADSALGGTDDRAWPSQPCDRRTFGKRPAIPYFTPPDVSAVQEVGAVQEVAGTDYDGVVIEMERSPYDVRILRDRLQYTLNRCRLFEGGTQVA
jgi:hypothetical protein